jgi:hypothetical protein
MIGPARQPLPLHPADLPATPLLPAPLGCRAAAVGLLTISLRYP